MNILCRNKKLHVCTSSRYIFWHQRTYRYQSKESMSVLWHIGRCQKEVLILCFSIDKDLAWRCVFGDIRKNGFVTRKGDRKAQVGEIDMMAKQIEKNLWQKGVWLLGNTNLSILLYRFCGSTFIYINIYIRCPPESCIQTLFLRRNPWSMLG